MEVTSKSSSATGGFFPDFETQIPPCGYLSGATIFPGYTVIAGRVLPLRELQIVRCVCNAILIWAETGRRFRRWSVVPCRSAAATCCGSACCSRAASRRRRGGVNGAASRTKLRTLYVPHTPNPPKVTL